MTLILAFSQFLMDKEFKKYVHLSYNTLYWYITILVTLPHITKQIFQANTYSEITLITLLTRLSNWKVG